MATRAKSSITFTIIATMVVIPVGLVVVAALNITAVIRLPLSNLRRTAADLVEVHDSPSLIPEPGDLLHDDRAHTKGRSNVSDIDCGPAA